MDNLKLLLLILPHFTVSQYYSGDPGFYCYDGSWLAGASRCNSIPECSQGEDEFGCPNSNQNLVKLPREHQQKIYLNQYPDYQDYQQQNSLNYQQQNTPDYQDYQQQGKASGVFIAISQ